MSLKEQDVVTYRLYPTRACPAGNYDIFGPKDEQRTIFFLLSESFCFLRCKTGALGEDYGYYRIVVNNLFLRQKPFFTRSKLIGNQFDSSSRFYQYLNVFDLKFMQTLSKTCNDLTLNS